MKKIQKKLVLKKKTIAQLNQNALSNQKLNQVQGGQTGWCDDDIIICITLTCTSYDCLTNICPVEQVGPVFS